MKYLMLTTLLMSSFISQAEILECKETLNGETIARYDTELYQYRDMIVGEITERGGNYIDFPEFSIKFDVVGNKVHRLFNSGAHEVRTHILSCYK